MLGLGDGLLKGYWSLSTCGKNRPLILHTYGPGTRFGASQARIGCVVCVSHLSFRFSSALECRSAITVVFLAFPIEAELVLHSSFMIFTVK